MPLTEYEHQRREMHYHSEDQNTSITETQRILRLKTLITKGLSKLKRPELSFLLKHLLQSHIFILNIFD